MKLDSIPQRKKRSLKVIRLLKKHYPGAECSLIYKNPLELLISTMLSAQCTDARVNKVTPTLFAKFPRTEDLAKASVASIIKIIYSTGFYKNKAKNIKACCQKLVKDYEGQVPDKMEDLVTLPGVGRKTANVVLGNAFGIPGMVVDTHVTRISNRLGFAQGRDAVKLERELEKVVPKKEWTGFSHYLIEHGRAICRARHAKCEECFLRAECPRLGLK